MGEHFDCGCDVCAICGFPAAFFGGQVYFAWRSEQIINGRPIPGEVPDRLCPVCWENLDVPVS